MCASHQISRLKEGRSLGFDQQTHDPPDSTVLLNVSTLPTCATDRHEEI